MRAVDCYLLMYSGRYVTFYIHMYKFNLCFSTCHSGLSHQGCVFQFMNVPYCCFYSQCLFSLTFFFHLRLLPLKSLTSNWQIVIYQCCKLWFLLMMLEWSHMLSLLCLQEHYSLPFMKTEVTQRYVCQLFHHLTHSVMVLTTFYVLVHAQVRHIGSQFVCFGCISMVTESNGWFTEQWYWMKHQLQTSSWLSSSILAARWWSKGDIKISWPSLYLNILVFSLLNWLCSGKCLLMILI